MQRSLGELLKKLRLERQFTQTQIADRLGITRQAYAYYENCNVIPDLPILMKLADLYDISVQLFLDYYPLEESSQIAEAGDYQPNLQQTLYPDYLAFYSEHDNMKKYHHLNTAEKKLLFLFQRLPRSEQLELLNWAYYKSTSHPDTIFLSEITSK